MFDLVDLRHLTSWCALRRLSWQPSQMEDGTRAVLLRRAGPQACWSDRLLVVDEDGVTLLDENGAPLAAASGLSALLDAMDAGVAASLPPWMTGQATGISPSLWNNPGSLIT
jgi:hypothetical protein